MKKALWYIVGLAFLLSALAFAADKPVSKATKTDNIKTNIIKAAKMNARGKVIEISDEVIKIERTVRGNVETMKFALEKPTDNIVINDHVTIYYIENEGKLAASRVTKATPKKKEIKPVAEKSASDQK